MQKSNVALFPEFVAQSRMKYVPALKVWVEKAVEPAPIAAHVPLTNVKLAHEPVYKPMLTPVAVPLVCVKFE